MTALEPTVAERTRSSLDRTYGTEDPAWLADLRRPIGERRLDIEYWDAAERSKPMHDRFVKQPDGSTALVAGARYCVVLVRWTGERWTKARRLSGPMKLEAATLRLLEEARRRKLECCQ